MLHGIGSAAYICGFLERVKDESDSVRSMGFDPLPYQKMR